jgi:DNA (cytosine-5)-methyltransferase 1
MDKINYIDLFSGIGGFHLGLLQAGFEFGWTGHSEIDKYANQVYRKHFSESEDLGDVRTIDLSRLPRRINLITFGFPCQDLSVAGKRGGISAKRSGLFFDAMRIIEATTPDIFIFENVKGLFSSGNGRDFQTVLQTIADLGIYECQWQLLNTRWFLPQNRERVYLVGSLRGNRRPEVFPIGEGNKASSGEHREEAFLQHQHSSSITSRQFKGGGQLLQVGNVDTKGNNSIWGRVYSPEGVAATLTDGGGLGAKTGLYEVSPCVRSEHHNTADIHFIHIDDPYNEKMTKYTTGIRRLTPIECERLQGFPDGWTEGLSDSQRYKCLGNAVSVPVVKTIGERLLHAIEEKTRQESK